MDPIVFIPSASLGLGMALAYCVRCLRAKQQVEVGTVVNAVLNSAGVVAGALLILSAFHEPIRKTVSDLEIYIVISGVVVLAVSAKGLARDVLGL